MLSTLQHAFSTLVPPTIRELAARRSCLSAARVEDELTAAAGEESATRAREREITSRRRISSVFSVCLRVQGHRLCWAALAVSCVFRKY